MAITHRVSLLLKLLVLLELVAVALADPPFVPNVALVRFQPGAEATALPAVGARLDLAASQRIGSTNIYRLQSKSQATSTMLSILKARPDVVFAEPDYLGRLARVPNDPYWPDPGMWNLLQVAAPSAWDVTTGTASVVVGMLDSGARYTHQDLAANMWNNPGAIGNCPAATHGYDFVNNTCYPTDLDYASHGTANAGIIGAAGNNSLGLTRINWTTSVMALKVATDSTDVSVMNSRVIAAIDFAVQAKLSGVNIRVLNLSIITEGYSHLVQDEINLAGDNNILTVVAAGNSSCNLDSGCLVYPARLNPGTMVTVAATGPNAPNDSIATMILQATRTTVPIRFTWAPREEPIISVWTCLAMLPTMHIAWIAITGVRLKLRLLRLAPPPWSWRPVQLLAFTS